MTLHEFAIKNNLFHNKLKGLHIVDNDLYYFGTLVAKSVREYFVYDKTKIIYNFLNGVNSDKSNNEFAIFDLNDGCHIHGGISPTGKLYYADKNRIIRINEDCDESILILKDNQGFIEFFYDFICVKTLYNHGNTDSYYFTFYNYDGHLLVNETRRDYNYNFYGVLTFGMIDTLEYSLKCRRKFCYDKEYDPLHFLEAITCNDNIDFPSIEKIVIENLRRKNLITSIIEDRYYELKNILQTASYQDNELESALLNIIYINRKLSVRNTGFISARMIKKLKKLRKMLSDMEFKAILISASSLENKLSQLQ